MGCLVTSQFPDTALDECFSFRHEIKAISLNSYRINDSLANDWEPDEQRDWTDNGHDRALISSLDLFCRNCCCNLSSKLGEAFSYSWSSNAISKHSSGILILFSAWCNPAWLTRVAHGLIAGTLSETVLCLLVYSPLSVVPRAHDKLYSTESCLWFFRLYKD